MTLLTELNSLSITANAKKVFAAKGVDATSLITAAKETTIELQRILTIIIGLHPSSGGDAANAATLASILAELA